jgi:hypothetical protein
MKTVYLTRIEHLQTEEVPSMTIVNDDEEEDEFDTDVVFSIDEDEEQVGAGDELAWIELDDFFDEHDVRKKSKRVKATKQLKKLFKKGDSRVDSFNGDLIVLAGGDYGDVFKKRGKKHRKK